MDAHCVSQRSLCVGVTSSAEQGQLVAVKKKGIAGRVAVSCACALLACVVCDVLCAVVPGELPVLCCLCDVAVHVFVLQLHVQRRWDVVTGWAAF